MFQRLDELQTGSLFILTGQAGAGKSHLAASARRGGTLWVLDTEGAAQNLSSKPGIHRRIQVLQSLSLKALVEAMDEIRKLGKSGDTVILELDLEGLSGHARLCAAPRRRRDRPQDRRWLRRACLDQSQHAGGLHRADRAEAGRLSCGGDRPPGPQVPRAGKRPAR